MMKTTKLGHWKSCCNRKECSECGFVYYAQRPEFKFCPSCGAKMDEKVKNELFENPEQLDGVTDTNVGGREDGE